MKIDEVAKRLDDCANNRNCDRCEFELLKGDKNTCRTMLIRDMADECRRIVEESEDDGK